MHELATVEDETITLDPDTFYDKEDWSYDGTDVDKYINDHILDLKTYQKYEDRYNCSGMCHPGLFYFSNPLVYGPPKETCLAHFVHHLN